MMWKLLTTRFHTRRSPLVILGLVLVMLAVSHGSIGSIAAQPVSSPAAGQQTPPGPGQQPNATGDPGDNTQIGISIDDPDSDAFRYLFRVDDPQRILKLDQRIELANDAQRLTNHGIPTIVVVRESAETRDQSQAVAGALRIDRGVESRGGADDGMVMLVTTDPASPRSGSVVLSFGRNALPKGGLTADSAESVYERVIAPRLARGRLYSALHVGIREIIYLETYIPKARPPMTDSERIALRTVNVLGPLALAGSAAGFVFIGRTLSVSGVAAARRRSGFRRIAVIVGLGTVCLFVAAVGARSAIGVASVVLLVSLLWTQYLIERSSRNSAPAGVRSLTLSYRRTFRPARHGPAARTTADQTSLRPRRNGR